MELTAKKSILGPIFFVAFLLLSSAFILGQFFTGVDEESFLPFGAAFGIFVYLLTLADIRIGIGICILAVGLSPEFTIGGIPNLRLEDFLVPVLVFAWITRILQQREKLEPSVIVASYFLYFAIGVVSLLFGLMNDSVKTIYSVLVTVKFLEYGLILLLVMNNLKTLEDAKAIIIFIIACSVVTCLYSFIITPAKGKVMGPFGESANILGGYIVMNMGVLLGFYAFLKSTTTRAVVSLLLLFLFYVLIYTHSRTSWSALILGLLIFSILKRKHLLVAFFALMIIFLIAAPQELLERGITILSIGTEQAPPAWQARVSSWNDYFEIIQNNPILGKGAGFVHLGDVDNEYVRVLVDSGLIGFLSFLFFLFLVGRTANSTYEKTKDINSEEFAVIKSYSAGFFMAWVMVIVHCLGATTLTSIRTMSTFMILAAIMNVINNRVEEWSEKTGARKIIPEDQIEASPQQS